MLRAAFAAAHSGMGMFADCSYSGTTATVCVLLPTRQTHLDGTPVTRLLTGWVGDSRAVIGRRSFGDATAEQLTVDLAPDETIVLLLPPCAFSRCFNRDRQGVSSK